MANTYTVTCDDKYTIKYDYEPDKKLEETIISGKSNILPRKPWAATLVRVTDFNDS
jgi:hypothetical protein